MKRCNERGEKRMKAKESKKKKIGKKKKVKSALILLHGTIKIAKYSKE